VIPPDPRGEDAARTSRRTALKSFGVSDPRLGPSWLGPLSGPSSAPLSSRELALAGAILGQALREPSSWSGQRFFSALRAGCAPDPKPTTCVGPSRPTSPITCAGPADPKTSCLPTSGGFAISFNLQLLIQATFCAPKTPACAPEPTKAPEGSPPEGNGGEGCGPTSESCSSDSDACSSSADACGDSDGACGDSAGACGDAGGDSGSCGGDSGDGGCGGDGGDGGGGCGGDGGGDGGGE
jgi:hypothetical protein